MWAFATSRQFSGSVCEARGMSLFRFFIICLHFLSFVIADRTNEGKSLFRFFVMSLSLLHTAYRLTSCRPICFSDV